MSSRNLKRQANTVLKEMTEIAKRVRQDVYRRSHILVMDPQSRELQGFILGTYLNTGTKPQLKGQALVDSLIRFHYANAPRTWKFAPKTYKPGATVSIKAPSFGSFSDWKRDKLPAFFFNESVASWNNRSKKEKAALRQGITGANGVGLHLGHLGDSVVSVTASEKIVTKKTESADRIKIIKDLQKIRSSFGLSGTSDLKVTRKGGVRKDAEFRIIYEAAEENLGKSSLEKQLSNEMKKYLTDIAFGESSRSVSTALLDTLEDALRHGKVVRVGSEKGRVKESVKSQDSVPVQSYAIAGGMSKGRRRSNKAYDDFAVNSYMNARITNEVTSRMGSPRLNYRTGRFADSVKIARSRQEPRSGVVTVEYTYQRAPYEVFEQGNSAMATAQRDPRLVIGESIRAIAKEMAIKQLKLRRI